MRECSSRVRRRLGWIDEEWLSVSQAFDKCMSYSLGRYFATCSMHHWLCILCGIHADIKKKAKRRQSVSVRFLVVCHLSHVRYLSESSRSPGQALGCICSNNLMWWQLTCSVGKRHVGDGVGGVGGWGGSVALVTNFFSSDSLSDTQEGWTPDLRVLEKTEQHI